MHFTFASADLDRQYALETIGYLKSLDNIDGLFTEYVAHAYKDFHTNVSRFTVHDLSQADTILSQSQLPYYKLIQDPDILSQLAHSTRTESIVRTVIKKEGQEYFFTLDWLHTPKMDQIASVRFKIDASTTGNPLGNDFLSGPLQTHLALLFSQVPFIANVTGRDHDTITVGIGARENLQKGDRLVIATLDEIKRHPLLKTIVDWKLTPTGQVIVEQVEENMAFCKITEQEPGQEITRYQKVIQIQSVTQANIMQEQQTPVMRTKGEISIPTDPLETPPTLGEVSLAFPIGGYNWLLNSPINAAAFSGGDLALGAKVDTQIWLTRNWFADIGFRYSFWNFTQQNTQTASPTPASLAGGVSGSVSSFKVDLGYSYLVNNDFFGPKGWLKLGYKTDAYSLPVSAIEFTGPISFGSLFIGIGGSLPIANPWTIRANVNIRLISSVSQDWLNETNQSNSDIEFYLGGSYRLSTNISAQCGLEVIASDASFSSGTTISQKTITFAPQLLYYF